MPIVDIMSRTKKTCQLQTDKTLEVVTIILISNSGQGDEFPRREKKLKIFQKFIFEVFQKECMSNVLGIYFERVYSIELEPLSILICILLEFSEKRRQQVFFSFRDKNLREKFCLFVCFVSFFSS